MKNELTESEADSKKRLHLNQRLILRNVYNFFKINKGGFVIVGEKTTDNACWIIHDVDKEEVLRIVNTAFSPPFDPDKHNYGKGKFFFKT